MVQMMTVKVQFITEFHKSVREMIPYAKVNKGFHYISVVTVVLSKFGSIEPDK